MHFSLFPTCLFTTEPKKIAVKLPKELEAPQMKDHQMFDRERLVYLQDKLQDKFKALKVKSMGSGGGGG